MSRQAITDEIYFRLRTINNLPEMLITLQKEFPQLLSRGVRTIAEKTKKQMKDSLQAGKVFDLVLEPLHTDTLKVRRKKGNRSRKMGGRLKDVLRTKMAEPYLSNVGFISETASQTARYFVAGHPNAHVSLYAALLMRPPPKGRKHQSSEWPFIEQWRIPRDLARIAEIGIRTYPARPLVNYIENAKQMEQLALQNIYAMLQMIRKTGRTGFNKSYQKSMINTFSDYNMYVTSGQVSAMKKKYLDTPKVQF